MPCCGRCSAADAHFGADVARRDLERYRENGPDVTTSHMLETIRAAGRRLDSLLDVGAGVGVLHHELMDSTVVRVVHVEAAHAYIDVAREEDERRGWKERVTYVAGDAVACVEALPESDLVTLDRVICCYPDAAGLVEATVSRARRLYALSLPRERWWVRLGVAVQNLARRLGGNDFRTFVHSIGRIEANLEERGFQRIAVRRTPVWHVGLYERRMMVGTVAATMNHEGGP